MLHDNDNSDPSMQRILPGDLAKRKYPEVDGLYAVKCKDTYFIGLLRYAHKEWLAYPSTFSLDTNSINSKIEFCIGPIPETD